jgi:hypothetical protein
MIEDNCGEDARTPIPNVTGKSLANVIEYSRKHVTLRQTKLKHKTDCNAMQRILAKIIQPTLHDTHIIQQ